MPRGTTVPPDALDDTDRAILRVLRDDGRASHREVSARTGFSLATVNRRIRALQDRQVIQGYSARIEPHAAGWAMTIMAGLRIDKGHLRPVQERIAQDPRVFAVYDVTGEWDGYVLARVRDRADMDELIKTTLSSPHIQRTSTMVVLATVQEDAIPRIPDDR